MGRIERVQLLLVNSDDLLMGGHVAGLPDRRPARAGDMRVGQAGGCTDQRPDLVAGGIETEQSHQHRVAAERGDIAGDIAGAAEHALRPLQQQHRNRRFRGNPFGGAIGKLVEHDVAKTQDPGF